MSEIHIRVHISTEAAELGIEKYREFTEILKADIEDMLERDRAIIDGRLVEKRCGHWIVERDAMDHPNGESTNFRRITCSECKELKYWFAEKLPRFCEECGAWMNQPPREIIAEGGNAAEDESVAEGESAAEGGNDATEGGKSCNSAKDAAGIIQTAAEGGGWALLQNRQDESIVAEGGTAAEGGNTAAEGESTAEGRNTAAEGGEEV